MDGKERFDAPVFHLFPARKAPQAPALIPSPAVIVAALTFLLVCRSAQLGRFGCFQIFLSEFADGMDLEANAS
jgi:hypothetical protein